MLYEKLLLVAFSFQLLAFGCSSSLELVNTRLIYHYISATPLFVVKLPENLTDNPSDKQNTEKVNLEQFRQDK